MSDEERVRLFGQGGYQRCSATFSSRCLLCISRSPSCVGLSLSCPLNRASIFLRTDSSSLLEENCATPIEAPHVAQGWWSLGPASPLPGRNPAAPPRGPSRPCQPSPRPD